MGSFGCRGRAYGTGRACNPLSAIEAAYIAGIIDGEGCIDVARCRPDRQRKNGRFLLLVTINMTSSVVLDWLNKATGLGTTKPIHRGRRPGQRPYYGWQAVSAGAASLLQQVVPYLVLKREHAQLLLDTHVKLTADSGLLKDMEWRDAVGEKFAALNARGFEPHYRHAARLRAISSRRGLVTLA